MIKLNGKTIFTEQEGKYTARFSLNISPDESYNLANLYLETPITKEQYPTIKESIKPGNKVNINIEGILEALASVEFSEDESRK